jgi:hypothetical protein
MPQKWPATSQRPPRVRAESFSFSRRTLSSLWAIAACCQTLSVPPTLKYESDGGPGVETISRLLEGSGDALADQKSSKQPSGTRMTRVHQKARCGMCSPSLGRNHSAMTVMVTMNSKRLSV